MIFTLDTNIYIDALRQSAEMDRLKRFLTWALPTTILSSVVAAELSSGARNDSARLVLERSVLGPFERRGRIKAPSASAWSRVGAILSATPVGRLAASRQNDLLIAAQAREHGWVIVTRDRDFRALRRVIPGLHVVEPFPDPT